MRKKSAPSNARAAHRERPLRALVAVKACTTAALMLGAAACDERGARVSGVPADLVAPVELAPPPAVESAAPIVDFVAGIPAPPASGSEPAASATPSAVAVSKPPHIPPVLPPRLAGVAPVHREDPLASRARREDGSWDPLKAF